MTAPVSAGATRDPRPGPRDARHLAQDLHDVLRAGGEPGPYVLVGHSLSGLTVRVFAVRYPASIVGLVLGDAASSDDATRLPPEVEQQQRQQFAPTGLCSGVTPLDRFLPGVGWARMTSSSPAVDDRYPRWVRPLVAASAQRWVQGRSPGCEAAYAEHAALPADGWQTTAAGGLGRLPLAVVTRGLPETWPPPVPVAATEGAWHPEQDDLGRLSSRSLHLEAPHARHDVELDQPGVVVQALDWVNATARS